MKLSYFYLNPYLKINSKKEHRKQHSECSDKNNDDVGNEQNKPDEHSEFSDTDKVVGNEKEQNKHKEHSEKEQDRSNNSGQVTLNKVYSVKRSEDFPNDDSFVWKPFGRKQKKAKYQTFKCIADPCSALKKARIMGIIPFSSKLSSSSNS